MMNDTKQTILCIDIGGSKYMIGFVNEDGRILAAQRHTWPSLTRQSVMECITNAARSLQDSHPSFRPSMVGVTIPGLADPRRGRWVDASFSGIRDLAIGPLLEEALALPVYIDNDGQACALAERLFGACKDVRNFLYLTVSNGIGGAVFVNDTLCYGTSGHAGELGHCVVVPGGRACKCGNAGCLEVYAAGPAIARNFVELGGPKLIDGRPSDAEFIAQLAQQGDDTALRAYELAGRYIGQVVATACNILNPRKVIVGGGVSLAFALFGPAMRDTVTRMTYRRANLTLDIAPTALGYHGGLLGAAAVAVCARDSRHGWGLT